MADTKDTGEKTLRVAPSKTLTIKRPVEQGVVRQSFSHGRSKAVVVEKVKRRVVGPDAPVAKAEAPAAAPAVPVKPPAPAPAQTPSGRAAPPRPGGASAPQAPRSGAPGVVLRTLTEEEREARARALLHAKSREEEERRQAEIDARARAEREAQER